MGLCGGEGGHSLLETKGRTQKKKKKKKIITKMITNATLCYTVRSSTVSLEFYAVHSFNTPLVDITIMLFTHSRAECTDQEKRERNEKEQIKRGEKETICVKAWSLPR